MAYTRVTNTKSGSGAIRYAFEESTHKEGVERVLQSSGNNLDPHFAMEQMRKTWDSFNKKEGESVQMYRIIQSFSLDELDPSNLEDIDKANAIGLELASELYNDKQSLVVTQADGEGGKLHNHILVNSVGFVDGKSLRGERTGWKHISKASDRVIDKYGLTPIESGVSKDKRTMGEIKRASRGEYVWKDDLKARINETMSNVDIVSESEFQDTMRDDFGVDVKFANRGLSYSFVDDDNTQRKARASRLGSDFGKQTLEDKFKENEIEQERIGKESDFDFDFDKELLRIRPRRPTKPKVVPVIEEITKDKVIVDVKKDVKDDEYFKVLTEEYEKQLMLDELRQSEEEERLEKLRVQQEFEQEQKAKQERLDMLKVEQELKREQMIKQKYLDRINEGQDRIKNTSTNSLYVDDISFVEKFMDTADELDGKTKISGLTGNEVYYTDRSIFYETQKRIKDSKQDKSSSSIKRTKIKEDDSLEL